jgi:D-glycero-D-manno-heptose 1,7-bisphosphate phosphatase
MAKRRALFLDRDGTINVDYGYVYKPEDFHFIDGIFELVAESTRLDYLNIIVTNQSGIGRGYFSESDFHNLMLWVSNQFIHHDGKIHGIYFCPDHPEYGVGKYKRDSIMRKPSPGMILKAAEEHNISLDCSVLVGDSLRDIEAGKAAAIGCNLLFKERKSEEPSTCLTIQAVNSLNDVIAILG